MPPRPSASLTRATLAVAAKELRSGLRDRQTALYTLVLPVCLYPVLFWVLIQGALVIQGRREHTEVNVGVSAPAGVQPPAGLEPALAYPRPELPPETPPEERAVAAAQAEARALERVALEPAPPFGGREAAAEWLRAPAQAQAEDRRPDALLLFEDVAQAAARDETPAALLYDSTAGHSSLARRRVERRLAEHAATLRAAAARDAGADPARLVPFGLERRNVAGSEDMGAFLMSFVLPILLVVMTVMGAFFPAVDLTAGERERGTTETTLLLPVPRLAVHQGKILAVCASALIATALNLLALGLSAGHLLRMLGAGTDLRIEVPLLAFASIAPLALLFAFSVSAVLTGVAALARTFKEGQAMLGPVQMVFILPAMAGALPGLELGVGTAFVPVVNVVLAFRAMLRGELLPLEFSLCALALLVYAVLAIALAVRILSRETLQVSGVSVSLRRLASLLRSPANTP